VTLTPKQWKTIAPYLDDKPAVSRIGRPVVHSNRRIMNAVLWVLRTGAPWHDLPKHYPPYQTCHRRYRQWVEQGKLTRALKALATDLEERGDLNLDECFIDGAFIPAKKGDTWWVKPNGERVRNSWQLQTALLIRSPLVSRLLHHTR